MTLLTGLLVGYGVCAASFALFVTFMYGFAPTHRIMRWVGANPMAASIPGHPGAADFIFNVLALVLFWWWAYPLFQVLWRVIFALGFILASPVILPYKLGQVLRRRRDVARSRVPRAQVRS